MKRQIVGHFPPAGGSKLQVEAAASCLAIRAVAGLRVIRGLQVGCRFKVIEVVVMVNVVPVVADVVEPLCGSRPNVVIKGTVVDR
ncbi:hypothetical protein AXG93_2491s1000 [Marchantia polymorpha subsp. ruderalis]|uniref:Uncharacterized protein n=1 Tax=Marchantia polymorpha subsp. ruderalis TaxID=1480154 RepID=A0A176VLE5_MARPO|nr:hypothetical protein AXG93_2491s1000 [Marchantia polymorpha subsp. ruderalis]